MSRRLIGGDIRLLVLANGYELNQCVEEVAFVWNRNTTYTEALQVRSGS